MVLRVMDSITHGVDHWDQRGPVGLNPPVSPWLALHGLILNLIEQH